MWVKSILILENLRDAYCLVWDANNLLLVQRVGYFESRTEHSTKFILELFHPWYVGRVKFGKTSETSKL